MRIAIIGAGFTGLTAAYRLSQKGHHPVVFEKESQAGGLASGFQEKDWQWPLEKFFHHFFTSDSAAQNLIQELDLGDKLFFPQPKTSIFKRGQISQFDSPLGLLAFPHLSLLEKVRTGAVIAYLKTINSWQGLEKVTASAWLKKTMGQKPYQLLWQPLLQGKFGKFGEKISMAWFWARIKKRSLKLGYLEGGFLILINRLIEKIKEKDGQVLLNHEVKSLEELKNFDRIIVTAPAEMFLKLISRLPKNYQSQLGKLKMLGALNLVLVLKEKFLVDNTYWLNINEAGFPFVAVVEHTNFVEPKHYAHQHLVYVGGYYPQNHPYFKMKKEQIFKEFLPFLKRINSRINPGSYQLFSSQNAQPVVPLNYSKIIPALGTPFPHLYLANMQMVYPWDRGVNNAIKLGEKVAEEALKNV